MSALLPSATESANATATQHAPHPDLPITDDLDQLMALVRREVTRRWSTEDGLLATMCRYALVPTGKLFRPMLLLESAAAVGGDVRSVLPAAVGAECGHVASLVHDDIIDHDDLRRGKPSVQHKFGVGDAIVAGDALIFDLFAGLANCRETGVSDDRVVSALDAVARAGVDLCRGQSLESELSREQRFDRDAYLLVAKLKTAAYFRGACESGAIMGGGTSSEVASLAAYGDHLGMAFQIQDDLLSYISGPDNTGKSCTSDVQNCRMTLPVILAYEACDEGGKAMIRRCLTEEADPDLALHAIGDLLDRTGTLDDTAALAADAARRARATLESLPPSSSRETLAAIADLVVARDR